MTINYSLLKTKQKSDMMKLFGKNIPSCAFTFALIISLLIWGGNFLLAFASLSKGSAHMFVLWGVIAGLASLVISIILVELAYEWTDKPYSKKDRDEEVLYAYTSTEIIIPLIIQACTVAVSFLYSIFLNPFILLAYIPFIVWIGYLYHRTWIKKCEKFATI